MQIFSSPHPCCSTSHIHIEKRNEHSPGMFRIFQYGNFVDMFMSHMLTYLSVPPYKGFSSKICVEFLPRTTRDLLGFLTLASCKMRSMGDSVCRRWVCITRSWVSWWGHTKMQEVCATFLEMIIIPSTTVRKKTPNCWWCYMARAESAHPSFVKLFPVVSLSRNKNCKCQNSLDFYFS